MLNSLSLSPCLTQTILTQLSTESTLSDSRSCVERTAMVSGEARHLRHVAVHSFETSHLHQAA